MDNNCLINYVRRMRFHQAFFALFNQLIYCNLKIFIIHKIVIFEHIKVRFSVPSYCTIFKFLLNLGLIR